MLKVLPQIFDLVPAQADPCARAPTECRSPSSSQCGQCRAHGARIPPAGDEWSSGWRCRWWDLCSSYLEINFGDLLLR